MYSPRRVRFSSRTHAKTRRVRGRHGKRPVGVGDKLIVHQKYGDAIFRVNRERFVLVHIGERQVSPRGQPRARGGLNPESGRLKDGHWRWRRSEDIIEGGNLHIRFRRHEHGALKQVLLQRFYDIFHALLVLSGVFLLRKRRDEAKVGQVFSVQIFPFFRKIRSSFFYRRLQNF